MTKRLLWIEKGLFNIKTTHVNAIDLPARLWFCYSSKQSLYKYYSKPRNDRKAIHAMLKLPWRCAASGVIAAKRVDAFLFSWGQVIFYRNNRCIRQLTKNLWVNLIIELTFIIFESISTGWKFDYIIFSCTYHILLHIYQMYHFVKWLKCRNLFDLNYLSNYCWVKL